MYSKLRKRRDVEIDSKGRSEWSRHLDEGKSCCSYNGRGRHNGVGQEIRMIRGDEKGNRKRALVVGAIPMAVGI